MLKWKSEVAMAGKSQWARRAMAGRALGIVNNMVIL